MPTSARRRATSDDVSFSPPRERPREWHTTEDSVRCRFHHLQNYAVTLRHHREALVGATGYVRIFHRCSECRPATHQMGFWDLSSRSVAWYALPSRKVRRELEEMASQIEACHGYEGSKVTNEMLLEVLRQRWNNPNE